MQTVACFIIKGITQSYQSFSEVRLQQLSTDFNLEIPQPVGFRHTY